MNAANNNKQISYPNLNQDNRDLLPNLNDIKYQNYNDPRKQHLEERKSFDNESYDNQHYID